MSKLVIVESPSKAKTIKKYLGKGYEVTASNGHIRDLPKSTLGVDVENDFTPKYVNMKGKSDVIKSLKKLASNADEIYLATDPDREGEAISWHLAHILNLDNTAKTRVTFNEITQKAVTAGINNPREIDLKLVDSQQARRILDRLVGYKLSPFLWKKIKGGLSAGRVQSVATKIIVDREREISSFVPEEYWNLSAKLSKDKKSFTAKFFGNKDGKIDISSQEQCTSIVNEVEKADFSVQSVKTTNKQRQPLAPFITSTLQQDASIKFNMSSKNTMRIAQMLYEGISVADFGVTGLITYMRTDSLRISDDARDDAKKYILDTYGEDFYPKSSRVFKSKASAQDAHEAIRPTNILLTPLKIRESLTNEQFKVYKLIWDRFIASQMSASVTQTFSAEISANDYIFKASSSSVIFKGFTAVYDIADNDEKEKKSESLPPLEKGNALSLLELPTEQKFTQPPSRYNEASLIKFLEENGIGRPSTYSPTISTIIDRGYVEKDGRALKPTNLGEVTTDLMNEHFKEIVDIKFTASMENKLDDIENKDKKFQKVIEEFYTPFIKSLDNATQKMDGQKVKLEVVLADDICDKCGAQMVVKQGRYGKFIACPNYPECKNIKSIVQPAVGTCPKCGGNIIAKKSKKGKQFFGCEKYPDCDFVTWDVPTKDNCPKCGKTLFSKSYGKQIGCNAEGCDYLIDKKTDKKKK